MIVVSILSFMSLVSTAACTHVATVGPALKLRNEMLYLIPSMLILVWLGFFGKTQCFVFACELGCIINTDPE